MEFCILFRKREQALVHIDFRYFLYLALTLYILYLIFIFINDNIFQVKNTLFFFWAIVNLIFHKIRLVKST